jgi:hypothetical protein
MKKSDKASELAARLVASAGKPLQIPVPIKPECNTIRITLRPDADLWSVYVKLAAERTIESGRPISAQQIALEVLGEHING